MQSFSYEAKSRKYQGVFKVKSRVKTREAREIWSQQLERKQVPPKKGGGGQPGVRKGVSVPCWHATPVANAPLKPLNHQQNKQTISICKETRSLEPE